MDDSLVILTLPELRHIIEIAQDTAKKTTERADEIMCVFRNRYMKKATNITYHYGD